MRKALTRRLVSKIGAVAFAAAALGSSGVASAQTAVDDRVPKSNGDGMDTHLFRPAVDSKGFFSVNGSDILGKGDISFGLVLDYGLNLMRTHSDRTPTDTATGMECVSEKCAVSGAGSGVPALVRNSFQGTFGFNYGVANLGVVGVSIPVLLMTGDAAYQIGPNGALYNSGNFSQQSISGFNLHAKYRITRVDKTIGLAALLQVGLPIGNAPRAMGAEPGAWVWPQIVAEHRMAANRFRIGANVGYRLHGGDNPSFGNDSTGARQLEEGRLKYGNMGTFGLALSLRALDALDIVAESYGTYLTSSDTTSKQKLSQEIVGGIKLFIEKNSYLMMGAGSRAFSTGFEAADVRLLLGFVYEPSIGDRDGDGYKDDQDACPDEPEDFDGFQDGDGCPEPDNDNDGILDVDDRCPNVPEDRDGDQDEDGCPEGKADGDRDGDGILDSKDKCPDIPEDRDGFQDDDGCPEADNDKDGIPDKEDQCPNDAEDRDKFEDEDGCPDPDNDKDQIPDVRDKCPNDPETYNGYQDEDGCPDKGKVVIEGNDIIIFEKVQFETNSARILPASNEILNAVAAVLKGHPEFKVVEVGGHADERGSDEHNLRLTKARAASVMDALRSRGINSSRLLSQGYGEYCPLDDRSLPAAWDKNRRVEFKVVRTEEGDTGVKRGCEAARAKGIVPPQAK